MRNLLAALLIKNAASMSADMAKVRRLNAKDHDEEWKNVDESSTGGDLLRYGGGGALLGGGVGAGLSFAKGEGDPTFSTVTGASTGLLTGILLTAVRSYARRGREHLRDRLAKSAASIFEPKGLEGIKDVTSSSQLPVEAPAPVAKASPVTNKAVVGADYMKFLKEQEMLAKGGRPGVPPATYMAMQQQYKPELKS